MSSIYTCKKPLLFWVTIFSEIRSRLCSLHSKKSPLLQDVAHNAGTKSDIHFDTISVL